MFALDVAAFLAFRVVAAKVLFSGSMQFRREFQTDDSLERKLGRKQ